MQVPGGLVSKTFLTVLLEYFNTSDCSVRVDGSNNATKEDCGIKF